MAFTYFHRWQKRIERLEGNDHYLGLCATRALPRSNLAPL